MPQSTRRLRRMFYSRISFERVGGLHSGSTFQFPLPIMKEISATLPHWLMIVRVRLGAFHVGDVEFVL
jgi:hypothetical protein